MNDPPSTSMVIMMIWCWYADKKKSRKKKVIVLTSMYDNVRVTKDERRKPQVHKFYDHTKGGADFGDLISSNCSTRIKSKWWPLNSLAFILDTTRTNGTPFWKKTTWRCQPRNLHANLQELCAYPVLSTDTIHQMDMNQPNVEDKTGPVNK